MLPKISEREGLTLSDVSRQLPRLGGAHAEQSDTTPNVDKRKRNRSQAVAPASNGLRGADSPGPSIEAGQPRGTRTCAEDAIKSRLIQSVAGPGRVSLAACRAATCAKQENADNRRAR